MLPRGTEDDGEDTMRHGYGRLLVTVTLATTAALAAGCDDPDGHGGTTDANRPAAASSAASPPGRPSPTASPVRLAKISGACPVLAPREVTATLGSSIGTLAAREGPVDTSDGQSEYTCTYVRGSAEAFVFKLLVSPKRQGHAKDIIDAIAESGTAPEQLSGVGEAAVIYTDGGIRQLATARSYQTELRTVMFSGPSRFTKEQFTDLAALVLGRV